MTISTYEESIRACCPDLQIRQVESNTDGQNSDVFVVNGEWIFRFPKYEHVYAKLLTETELLSALKGRLPLAIPEPAYNYLEGKPVGRAFMGYLKIPGEPLWRETFREISSQETIDRLASQLGGFLHSLHTIPIAELGVDLPLDDTVLDWTDFYARIQEKLFPLMRPDAPETVMAHFDPYFVNPTAYEYKPALRHGDFGTCNLLYDSATGRINGVIDFGSSCLGDPAIDLAGLLSGYGEDFLGRILAAYPNGEAMLPRIHFYKGTFALWEALFGFENGDDEALKAGMATYS